MAATVTKEQLITAAVRDYYEAWFDGDADRMERALHPDLVKRRAGEELGSISAPQMIDLTRRGDGTAEAADRRLEIVVEDVYEGIASVTVRSAPYYEYLHVVRTREGWRIANVLYEPM